LIILPTLTTLPQDQSRILVVDDEPTICQFICAKLQSDGHFAVGCDRGRTGWQELKKTGFDLAVFDLDLPDIDGFSLIEQVRKHSLTQHLPVIVLTGRDDSLAIEKAYTAGATSFVTKPVNWAQFGYQVRYILRSDHRRKALQTAKVDAECANRHKDNFIKVMSHELRTPLHQIIGFSEVIQAQLAPRPDDGDLLGYVNNIADAGHRLLSSLTDIMLYSRMLSNDVELVEGEYDASRIMSVALGLVKTQAHSKNITISFSHCLRDCRITCDFQMLTRVLTNLLDNALKYSYDNGNIQVGMELADDGSLVLIVNDFGKGMEQGVLDVCQTGFLQEKDILIRTIEGLGMGLPIAKAIVKMHGGEIRIYSSPEDGTKVVTTVPAERVNAKARQLSHRPA